MPIEINEKGFARSIPEDEPVPGYVYHEFPKYVVNAMGKRVIVNDKAEEAAVTGTETKRGPGRPRKSE